MNMQDPISDMLTIIRNGQLSNKNNVLIIFSKIKLSIIKLLKYNYFIQNYYVKNINNHKFINIHLRYINNIPVISKIYRISKPSVRIFSKNNIKKFKDRFSILIISTSKGIMTDIDACKNNIGGEILFYIS